MKSIFIFCILIYANILYAKINLIKKENSDSNTTLLVIGGIHGNEPGGYFAPEILATHYAIKSKNVWIIPNLNEASIIADKRGIHGDMNRKFKYIKKNDKDKKIVEEIKKIILLPNISLILNLHDGHGFYRKKSEGNIYNPDAWGQSCVIDQCKLLRAQPFGNLNHIALTVKDNINKKLLKKHHRFNVKNTNTKNGNKAMQQSLTYFAIQHAKPAFAIETSKNLSSLAQKVFYQLVAIEEYMKIMHIKYSRDFHLNVKEVSKLLKDYGTLVINHNFLSSSRTLSKSKCFVKTSWLFPVSFESLVISIFSNELRAKFMYISCSCCILPYKHYSFRLNFTMLLFVNLKILIIVTSEYNKVLIMTRKNIESRIEELEKMKRNAERDKEAGLNQAMAQKMIVSSKKEIEELEVKLKNFDSSTNG